MVGDGVSSAIWPEIEGVSASCHMPSQHWSSVNRALAAKMSVGAALESARIARTIELGRALRDRAVLEVENESAKSELPFWKQGDDEVYTATAVSSRMALRRRPCVVDALETWWAAAQRTVSQGKTEMLCTSVSMHEYVRIFSLLFCDLTGGDEEEAHELVLEDWRRDAAGCEAMSREMFLDAVWELADTWTVGIEEDEYVAFLTGLYERVTVSPGLFWCQPIADANPLRRRASTAPESPLQRRASIAPESPLQASPEKGKPRKLMPQKRSPPRSHAAGPSALASKVPRRLATLPERTRPQPLLTEPAHQPPRRKLAKEAAVPEAFPEAVQEPRALEKRWRSRGSSAIAAKWHPTGAVPPNVWTPIPAVDAAAAPKQGRDRASPLPPARRRWQWLRQFVLRDTLKREEVVSRWQKTATQVRRRDGAEAGKRTAATSSVAASVWAPQHSSQDALAPHRLPPLAAAGPRPVRENGVFELVRNGSIRALLAAKPDAAMSRDRPVRENGVFELVRNGSIRTLLAAKPDAAMSRDRNHLGGRQGGGMLLRIPTSHNCLKLPGSRLQPADTSTRRQQKSGNHGQLHERRCAATTGRAAPSLLGAGGWAYRDLKFQWDPISNQLVSL